ncbi:MAG: DUF6221 family protein [Actinoallomurus sp.]
MSDLVEFLRARLDEDEQAAKCVRQPYRLYVDDSGRISEPKRIDDLHGERDGEYEQWADGEDRMPNHIVSWWLIYDPARALREVEAKRRLLKQFRLRGNSVRATVQPATGGVWDDLLRMLALPYADHPDYREEWRP